MKIVDYSEQNITVIVIALKIAFETFVFEIFIYSQSNIESSDIEIFMQIVRKFQVIRMRLYKILVCIILEHEWRVIILDLIAKKNVNNCNNTQNFV